jgi:hypothetical protein
MWLSLRVAVPLAVITGLALSTTSGPAAAATLTFSANLNGATEIPPTGSPGTGFAAITVDTVADTMTVFESFTGLGSPTTASHIHCCLAQPATVGVATQVPSFVNFPTGVMSGSFTQTLNMTLASSYNPVFEAANGGTPASAFAALLAGMVAGESYINIHTQQFTGGEIRGILTETPLPGALPLFATGIGALGLLGWRRKRKAQAVA